MRKALGGISAGIGAGVGFGIFQTATSIIGRTSGALFDATLTADSLQGGMEALTGSVETANQRLDEMRQLAKDPGLGFEQVTRGDISLQSVGLSAELSTRAMKEFGNALAVVGRGKADLDGVLLAITQIVSKGKVSAEEINQIAERVPQIRKVMQEAFGTADTEAIQKMGIPVERFIELVVSAFERTVPRAIVRMQGKIDNFTDAATARFADVGAGITEGLLGPLDEVTEKLENSSESSKAFGSSLGTLAGGALEAGKSLGSVVMFALDGFGDLAQKITMASLDMAGFQRVTKTSEEEMVRMKDAEAAAARVSADLARHQRELETATKRLADARAESTKRANEQAAAEAKLTLEVIKSTNAARDKFLTERGKTEDSYLSDQEKLEKVKERIAKIDGQMNATIGQKGGEEITYQLMAAREEAMQELLRLSQAINAENARSVTTDTKSLNTAAQKVADQEQALRLFELELAIAEAASRGQDRKVEKLERERDIIEQTSRLMSELGFGYDEAARKAEQLVNAEAKAAGRQTGSDAGGRNTIQGYSQDQGNATDARARAQSSVDESRANSEAAVRRSFGTFSEVDAAQKQKFGSLFGNAPAEQGAVKPTGDAMTTVADRLEAWAQTTTELFEKALQ
jgi:tape measure domain-containing protein